MWQCGLLIFLFLELDKIDSAISTDYIKPCSKTKDFKQCAIKNGNEALPFILKGDAAFKIPNLLPLAIPSVDADAGPNLKIHFTDAEILGLETITLKDIDVDFQKQTAYLSLDVTKVELIGTYDIDGKILVLPIQGHGKANITAANNKLKYTFSFKLENRGGKEYAIIQDDDKMEYEIKKAYFQLDNLFNGNQAMGDNVNKFLNENDQDAIRELGSVIEGTVRVVARTVGGGILANIPYHELFLD